MTSNQLSLREVKNKEASLAETKRSNLVNEALKQSQVQEEIANNLRNYRVNVSKNDIQRLANDQLNSRELQKITETIRSDLARELETNRHNLKEEELQRIQASNTALGKPGKYSVGAVIAAILGLMPEDEVKRLYGGSEGKVSSFDYGDDVRIPTDWGDPVQVTNFIKDAVASENSEEKKKLAEKEAWIQQAQRDIRDTHAGETVEITAHHNRSKGTSSRVSGHTGTQKKDTINEIPSDYSNSYGPSNQISANHRYLDANENPTSGIQESRHGTTSGGTDYTISGGHTSQGIIVAPRA